MLHTFWLVVQDLFWFVLGREDYVPTLSTPPPVPLPLAAPERPLSLHSVEPRQLIASPAEMPLIAQPAPSPLIPERTSVPVAQQEVHVEMVATPPSLLHAPVSMYVAAPTGAACLLGPHREFDCVQAWFPYGTAVTVVSYQGRFAHILRANQTGWILKDDLEPHRALVWPVFHVGTTYTSIHDDTKKTRLILSDMFVAGALDLPLQAAEYVMVRLLTDQRQIAWPTTRPRVPGAWQRILKGVHGIHIGINPKTDTVMEWQTDYGEGRLGYVERVAPDNTLTVTTIGYERAGVYSTLTLPESVWREFRPVFIEVV